MLIFVLRIIDVINSYFCDDNCQLFAPIKTFHMTKYCFNFLVTTDSNTLFFVYPHPFERTADFAKYYNDRYPGDNNNRL